jgi:hypothetical protein
MPLQAPSVHDVPDQIIGVGVVMLEEIEYQLRP